MYDVLKIYYTPDELQVVLGRIFERAAAHQTRDFFVIGRVGL
jgi:hypothetical protein